MIDALFICSILLLISRKQIVVYSTQFELIYGLFNANASPFGIYVPVFVLLDCIELKINETCIADQPNDEWIYI